MNAQHLYKDQQFDFDLWPCNLKINSLGTKWFTDFEQRAFVKSFNREHLLSSYGGGSVGSNVHPRKRKVGCSNPRRDRPKSLKQVVTAPLPNAQHQVWVSRVLRDDHYKRIPRDTVGVAR